MGFFFFCSKFYQFFVFVLFFFIKPACNLPQSIFTTTKSRKYSCCNLKVLERCTRGKVRFISVLGCTSKHRSVVCQSRSKRLTLQPNADPWGILSFCHSFQPSSDLKINNSIQWLNYNQSRRIRKQNVGTYSLETQARDTVRPQPQTYTVAGTGRDCRTEQGEQGLYMVAEEGEEGWGEGKQ